MYVALINLGLVRRFDGIIWTDAVKAAHYYSTLYPDMKFTIHPVGEAI